MTPVRRGSSSQGLPGVRARPSDDPVPRARRSGDLAVCTRRSGDPARAQPPRGPDSRTRPSGDDGTVLLLVLGLAVVLVGLVAVVTDVSALLLARRAVVNAADGAAVAGAQQLDEPALYAGALDRAVPLDRAAVRAAVAAYGAQAQPRTAMTGTVLADGVTVRVDAQRQVRLPFGGLHGRADVTVRAVAHATAPVLQQ